jgi:hypothetical protein
MNNGVFGYFKYSNQQKQQMTALPVISLNVMFLFLGLVQVQVLD